MQTRKTFLLKVKVLSALPPHRLHMNNQKYDLA